MIYRKTPKIEGFSYIEIAEHGNCHTRTISREMVRNIASQGIYHAVYAEKKARSRNRFSKT